MTQQIYFERGAIKKVGDILSGFSPRRVFLVTGNQSYALSGAKEALEKLLSSYEVERFAVSKPLPELDEIARGCAAYKKGNFDVILAVGGGNVLDTAKLIRVAAAQNHAEILSSIQSVAHKGAPLIALPTTAGSGAEATHFSVLYINDVKHSIAHPYVLPDFAVVDPELTLSLPTRMAAISGLDALSQGIESFWSIGATETSKEFARQAIRVASCSIESAVLKRDIDSCVELSRAALLAGQAINISKTTAPHAVSYIFTSRFNIPHGHAVMLTLGKFLLLAAQTTESTLNAPLPAETVQNNIKEICDLLDVPNPQAAQTYFHTLMKRFDLAVNLSTLNVQERDFDLIVKSVNLERLQNHPQKISAQDIYNILREIA